MMLGISMAPLGPEKVMVKISRNVETDSYVGRTMVAPRAFLSWLGGSR